MTGPDPTMVAVLVVWWAAALRAAAASSTVVAGMVLCDQCKDGTGGLLDYPLYGGALVAIQCGGGGGETLLTVRESSTNWFGGFSVRVEGSPDMSGCTARVVQGTAHCGAPPSAAAARELALSFRMLGLALYTVRPLLSQPQHAMDFCPGVGVQGAPADGPVSSPADPPAQGSACSYDKWLLAEHGCHWKVVTPNTTVAMALGRLAGQRYGKEMTLREALLDGRGGMYRTLLREATAALLNAYYNGNAAGGPFLYPTRASVMDHMNGALLSSPRRVVIEAARFRRANAGGGGRTKLPCDFTPCTARTTA